VANRLRGNGVRAALVALTGYGQAEDIERAVKAGFDAHAAKPVELSKLQEMLRGVAPARSGSPVQ
jgi:CheY-like chemotaxis protein